MQVHLDLSEHHILTKLLKSGNTSDRAETQEETASDEQHVLLDAFQEFRRRRGGKVTV